MTPLRNVKLWGDIAIDSLRFTHMLKVASYLRPTLKYASPFALDNCSTEPEIMLSWFHLILPSWNILLCNGRKPSGLGSVNQTWVVQLFQLFTTQHLLTLLHSSPVFFYQSLKTVDIKLKQCQLVMYLAWFGPYRAISFTIIFAFFICISWMPQV